MNSIKIAFFISLLGIGSIYASQDGNAFSVLGAAKVDDNKKIVGIRPSQAQQDKDKKRAEEPQLGKQPKASRARVYTAHDESADKENRDSKERSVSLALVNIKVDVKAKIEEPESPSFKEYDEFALKCDQGLVYNRRENSIDRTQLARKIMAKLRFDKNPIRAFLWSNDGKTFVTQSANNKIAVWDTQRLKPFCVAQGLDTDLSVDYNSLLSPDATKLAIVCWMNPDSDPKLRGYKDERELRFIQLSPTRRTLYKKPVSHVSWSHNSKFCAAPIAFGIEVFDAQTGKPVWQSSEKTNEGGFMWSADDQFIYTYDNKFLKSGDEPAQVHVYNALTGELVCSHKGRDGYIIKNMDVTDDGVSFHFKTSGDEYTLDLDGADIID